MSLDYISKPAMIKAIQFAEDGSNFDHILSVLHLNKAHAELIYTDKDGNPKPKGTITEHRAILVAVGRQLIVVPKGSYLILDPDGVFPLDKKSFEEMNVKLEDIDTIGNGKHTFRELYAQISQYLPTLEQILVSTHYRAATPEQAEYIRGISYCVTDSEGKEYHVVNGVVYVLD